MARPSEPEVRPCVDCALRLVSSPAKTPPATGEGAPCSGAPFGSMTVMVPSPAAPVGEFENQGRPLPLLSEMPVGSDAPVRFAVTTVG